MMLCFASVCLSLYLSVCLSVYLSVCLQDNSKHCRRILMKFLVVAGGVANNRCLDFGVDQNRDANIGNFKRHFTTAE